MNKRKHIVINHSTSFTFLLFKLIFLFIFSFLFLFVSLAIVCDDTNLTPYISCLTNQNTKTHIRNSVAHIQTWTTRTNQYKVYTWIKCTELYLQVVATAEWFIHFPLLCHRPLVMQQFNTNQTVFQLFLLSSSWLIFSVLPYFMFPVCCVCSYNAVIRQISAAAKKHFCSS